jgi:CheY-like chemotaxis protein
MTVVAQARNGREAVEMFRRERPHVALIDLTMPELDGFDTAALLRARSRARKAVFVAHTATDRAELLTRPDVVFDFYVRKPATVDAFAAAIEFARNLGPDPPAHLPGTLGDVLYAKSKTLALEAEWVALVRSVAAGNPAALQALFERAHRPAFTLIARILADRESAEELTLDLFDDIWRRTDRYDAADGTVLGWIMNQARSHAIDRQRSEQRKKRGHRAVEELPAVTRAADSLNLLEPSATLQERLARRIAPETRGAAMRPWTRRRSEPEWGEVSPGIFCKLLATDPVRHRVSMLVRLLPGVEYPPHTQAEFEELHLLDGELWIDERKLHPGDYNRAEAPTGDKRVWSETGCTCVLTTSTLDILT